MSKYKHVIKRQLKMLFFTEVLVLIVLSFACIAYNFYSLDFDISIFAKATVVIFISWCMSCLFSIYDIYSFWKR